MRHSRFAKVVILSSGQALTAVVGIVSMAVLTRVFSTLDYATYRQTILAYTFAVPFVTLGLDRALYFFLPGEQARPRAVLLENLLLLSLAGMLLSMFILLGGDSLLAQRLNNPDLAATLRLLAPYPLLVFPALSLGACLMARNRTPEVAAFNVGSRLVMLLCVLVPVLFWAKPSAAIIGTVASAGVTTLVAVWLMLRACPDGPWRPTLSGLKKQLVFAVPLGLAGLVGSVSTTLDQALVSLRCAPEAFAVYSVGAMEIPLIGMVTGAISSVVIVDYARYYREGRISDVVALIHQAMIRSATFLIPVMVFLLCAATSLMVVLFGDNYAGSAAPFRVYLLLLPIRCITFGAVLQAIGRSRNIMISAALSLAANAALGWLAVGWLGSIGAAFASVVTSYFVEVHYLIRVIRSTLQVPFRKMFPWLELVKILAATIIPAAGALAVILFVSLPHIVLLIAGGVVYSGLLLGVFLFTGRLSMADIAGLPKMMAGIVSR